MNVSISELLKGTVGLDSQVTIKGWVRTRRDSKTGISFVHVSDGSCFSPMQIIVSNTLSNYDSEILHLTTGCAVEVSGKLIESQGKGQKYEVIAEHCNVIGWVENPDKYPMQPKHHTPEYLREIAHLRSRTNVMGAVTRVRHCIAQAIHQFFHQAGFYWIHTPIITASDCEGAGELFRVSQLDMANLPRNASGQVDFTQDFFGQEAYLTVSGQLNLETYCLALSKVYTFGPTFRAENSNTARHLAEFWMVEPEIAFADLHDDLMLAENMLKHVLKVVLDECSEDMAFFAQRIEKTCIERLEKVLKSPFERIEYRDALKILEKAAAEFEYPVSFGHDLQSEHERYLCEKYFEKPVAVMNYPKSIKAFYMRLNDDEETVAAMDVLVPGVGEIIGGSQREERLEVLDRRMSELDIPVNNLWWY
ncbi:MAG TPA: asparagine--tRNA ligase, partial [Gammaproteobacteria bacterium]|nr:asparagine--tRNA ligase [Gammaproteobacteria bacterium]